MIRDFEIVVALADLPPPEFDKAVRSGKLAFLSKITGFPDLTLRVRRLQRLYRKSAEAASRIH